ncbi:MAG: acylneuraminate cytidylyltransferase family protein [Desulfarculus sp.]|nr:acylneuraminate cytidylyltransferase family protein [Desulfarculus sp.]
MPESMNILGLIPARGGSKGIPGKNLAPLAGKPLLAHTVEAGLKSRRLTRLVLSTDDPAIAQAGRGLGAEVPFMRPAELAQDGTPALPVIQHAVGWLEDQGWRPEVIVYLQPTSPLRRAEHIDAAVDLLLGERADTVVSVLPVPHQFNPASVMLLKDGCLKPFLPELAQLLRRQDKPEVFARNGPAVLACARAVVMDEGRLYGSRTLPLIMAPEDSFDIDTPFDLELVEWLLGRRG